MSENFVQSSWSKPDQPFELPLRPKSLEEFIGQPQVSQQLKIFLTAAKERGEAAGHCLLFGPPGLGKTTLAHIIAQRMGTHLTVTSGPSIEKAGDLAGLLTSMQVGDVLFIDEIHRLPKVVEEYLYSAMEDFSLDLIIDSGANARSVPLKLNPFTLVGATTRTGQLSAPMRSRFCMQLRLEYYDAPTLQKILLRSAQILKVSIDKNAALQIAGCARGTPRIANNLLRWVRDVAQIENVPCVDVNLAKKALRMLQIDESGLDEMDKKILRVIIDFHKGGPVGIETLSVACGEEASTLAEVYEPFLIMQGYLKRTLRGREATPLAYEHLKREPLP